MAEQIIDILLNLVENALKAIVDRGGVSTITDFSSHPNVQIEITDSGLGIPPEHQDLQYVLIGEQWLWSLGRRKTAQNNICAIKFTDQAGQRLTFTLRLRAAAERTVL